MEWREPRIAASAWRDGCRRHDHPAPRLTGLAAARLVFTRIGCRLALALHAPSERVGDEKGDDPADGEGHVDELPAQGESTDGPGDQCKRDDADAGDHPPLQDPDVADRVTQRADEGDRDDQVREGQPVSAVSDEWVRLVGGRESLRDPVDPELEPARGVRDTGLLQDARGEGEFMSQRERGDATDDQPHHDNDDPHSNPCQRCVSGDVSAVRGWTDGTSRVASHVILSAGTTQVSRHPCAQECATTTLNLVSAPRSVRR
jgi:hypothetical protein